MRITSDNFIKHFKRGKEAALEYVIDEYIGIVKAVIYNTFKIKYDRQLIEECISDTFLGAFENAKQFKGNQEDFRKWLCSIAKFKAIDYQRKIYRDPNLLNIDDQQTPVISAEKEYLTKETTEELYQVLKQLGEIDRDIFTMKYFLNMRNNDIANQLGLSKASVDNRLYRGKKKLREFHLGGIYS
ncbi:RNA polymerase sigma-70 factor (ECF subfamily) [Alkalibacillus filiformis]|uniref:RNA polymerase sigma-70 factor (ECF subfamily) n=1 Tax=Alkalibacillus filiformis TaxID=200990 RepID=A0ABU0DX03_9BACI|nr:sigma-70 family RNA polymerase sigma factor [Alkalibacillus filiformis]MDQ0352869.1 RNA polymerase sigma-70 factor (ECF subfamily) [Alkalibacillus filiformis]